METAACGRKDISDSKPWFVLVAMSPERVEYRLLKRNMHQEELMSREPDARKRPEMQRFLVRLFVPYTAMESNKEDDASLTGITLRSALHRYLFVSGDENLLKNLMVEWNNMFADKFFFLKDGSKNNAKICQSDIDKLRDADGIEAKQEFQRERDHDRVAEQISQSKEHQQNSTTGYMAHVIIILILKGLAI